MEQSSFSAIEPETPLITPAPQNIGKFKASMMIARSSWNLLLQDKEVLWFPILSMITGLMVIGTGAAIYFFGFLGGNMAALEAIIESPQNHISPLSYVVLFCTYFISYFITIFFQTGVVAIVNGRLNGQDLSFSDGLNVALRNAGKIASWSLLSATVGVVLRTIADRSQWLGKWVAGLLGGAWAIVTFFIVPVLILEDESIKNSLKSSGDTVKKMWGESIIVNVGAGFIFLLLALGGIILFILSLFSQSVAVILSATAILIAYLFMLVLLSSTLDVIFRVVLYQYAKRNIVPAGLSPEVLQLAFTQKENKSAA